MRRVCRLKDGYTMETTNEGALLTVEGDFAEETERLNLRLIRKEISRV